MSWDDRWMGLAEHIAQWSKDSSTKVGAVIVDERNNVLTLGWNGYPRGVDDSPPERQERPAKYQYTEHAERNAIYNAAASGQSLKGSTIYSSWPPCTDCARAIIQSGINCIVTNKDAPGGWEEDGKVSLEMLTEAKVKIEYYKGVNDTRAQDTACIPK